MSQQNVSSGNFPASKPFASYQCYLFHVCVSLAVIVVEVVTGPVKELPQRSWTMELSIATALI